MLQSNVEDVADYMRSLVDQTLAYSCCDDHPSAARELWTSIWGEQGGGVGYGRSEGWYAPRGTSSCLRGTRWAQGGGRRVQGRGWLRTSPLPTMARTETEAAYELADKPIYRIVYKVKGGDSPF